MIEAPSTLCLSIRNVSAQDAQSGPVATGGGLNNPKSYGGGGGTSAGDAAAAGRHSMLATKISIIKLTGRCEYACIVVRSRAAAAGLDLRCKRS